MEKLKLDLGNLPGVELLTKDQLKKVMGGVLSYSCPLGSSKCVTNSDCGFQQACKGIDGCCESGLGDSCTDNTDCGNNLKCKSNPYGAGNWCN